MLQLHNRNHVSVLPTLFPLQVRGSNRQPNFSACQPPATGEKANTCQLSRLTPASATSWLPPHSARAAFLLALASCRAGAMRNPPTDADIQLRSRDCSDPGRPKEANQYFLAWVYLSSNLDGRIGTPNGCPPPFLCSCINFPQQGRQKK